MRRSLAIVAAALALGMAVDKAAGQRFIPRPGGGKGGGRGGPPLLEMNDYEFTVLDNAKVRLLNPPVEFDDKGRPKKYTKEEVKKMKGATPAEQKLPGIKGAFDALKPGDLVQVSFARPSRPKDLAKSTWAPLGGAPMVGMVTNVEAGAGAKSLTVRVSPLLANGLKGPPALQARVKEQQRDPAMLVRMILRREAPKTTIKPQQRQANMIVVVEQGPDLEARPRGGGKRRPQ